MTGKKLGALIVAGVLVVALLGGVWLFFVNESVTTEGRAKEASLSTAYSSNQSDLSTCLTQISQSANIADEQSAKFIEAMKVAIEGRYTDRTANPGQMFGMIVEQYPDLKGLDSAFERVYITMQGCTDNFNRTQKILQDRLREYDTWRGTMKVRYLGGDEFPSENLYAQVGNKVLGTGQDALLKMRAVVQTAQSAESFESGTVDFGDPFERNKEQGR